MNVIDWGSSKMKVPSASPLSGESEAALMGYGKIKMLRFLIHEFTGLEIPAKLLTDSKSLMQAVNSNNSISDKRCAVAIAMIRRVQQADKIQVGWLKGTSQPADVLTKATANPKLLIDILREGDYSQLVLNFDKLSRNSQDDIDSQDFCIILVDFIDSDNCNVCTENIKLQEQAARQQEMQHSSFSSLHCALNSSIGCIGDAAVLMPASKSSSRDLHEDPHAEDTSKSTMSTHREANVQIL